MAGNPAAAARYTPGSWLGVVRSGTVVLLRPDSPAGLVESVWDLLGTSPQVHEVLDAVTSASGGSLARLPWFAIVDSRSAVQFFLRGEIDLTVDLPSGPVELSGRDVTTWTERRFATAAGFSLTVPGADATGASGPGLDLPLTDGVVLLRGLRVNFAGAAAPEVVSPAVTAATAVPAPLPETALPATARPAEVPAAADAAADEVLAAAEADIAAELRDHGASAETVLEFPGEDLELDGTLHEEPAPEPAEQEPTGSYDHLWEQTVMRNIEDAAVREDPDAAPESAAPESAAPESAAPESAAPESAAPESATPESAAPESAPGHASMDPAGPGTAPEPADSASAAEPPAAPRPAVPIGLIDSVPWLTGTGSGRPPSAGSSGQPQPPAAPLPPAAPQAPDRQVPAAQPDAQPDADADHDGQTVMKSDLAGSAQRPASARRPSTGPDTEPATGPMVLARVCPQGHANPSTYSHCGRCGEPLPGDGVQVRRPRLGRMRVSTGGLIDLDQSLIVGRQPSVSRVQGAVMPKLVQVASPSGDISRSHVEVRLEGWHVMLCDLKATNGTVLVREGQSPRRLAQGEMAILLDGDIAEVGDGISLRFEEIP